MPSESFGVTNIFKARFVDIRARWLFSRETHGSSYALMDVVDLWASSVTTYDNDALVYSHRYEHVVASRMRLAIGTEDMRVLMREGTTAV